MDEQKIAYIPIVTPDSFTMIPDGKLPGGETPSAMPLIHSIDKSVRGMKDDLWSFKKGTDNSIAEIKQNLSALREDATEIKGEIKVMNERIDKNLANYEAISSRIEGEVRAVNATVQALQQRRSWDIAWISLAVAIGIALIQIFSK